MNNKTATAMALALVAGVAVIGAMPVASAADPDCQSNDFSIPAVKPLTARTLSAGVSEIGKVDVLVSVPRDLMVQLADAGAAGELTWKVFHLDANQSCVQYTAGGCNTNNVLDDDTAPPVSCELAAPGSGTKSYWVSYEETGGSNAIDYFTWAPAA